jgi:type II secretion system protein G
VPDCRSKGFTLIELLVVVLIIGILAAIGIPTLLNAIDRGKQKRTMAEVRALAGAIQAYSVDHDIFPLGSDMSTLVSVLEGEYIVRVTLTDSWGHPFLYTGTTLDYTVGSTGKDGGSSLALIGGGGETSYFVDDIIYSKGSFVQWPDGAQQ